MTLQTNSESAHTGVESSKPILAVIVLYKIAAEQSHAFTSLQRAFAMDAAIVDAIDLILFDNTPYVQPAPGGYGGRYRQDTNNPGLARCYNHALAAAEADKVPWLMLLDQDTTLTLEYLQEVIAEIRQTDRMPQVADRRVVAWVPKLVEGNRVQSPHGRPTFQHTAFDLAAHGVAERELYAFNSGSVLRVQALHEIGGFPEDFWLDFLDHATFHLLQAGGGRIFVLKAFLAHELSSNDRVNKPAISRERYQGVLDAEHRFYQRFGTRADMLYSRVRLLRIFARTLLVRRNLGQALQALRAALRF